MENYLKATKSQATCGIAWLFALVERSHILALLSMADGLGLIHE
jgi:hypothetical protein